MKMTSDNYVTENIEDVAVSFHNSKVQRAVSKVKDVWQQQSQTNSTKHCSPSTGEVFSSALNVADENRRKTSADYSRPVDDSEEMSACRTLALRIEAELRAAKSKHLSCGEVLLPCDLLTRTCQDILRMAENEPCGLRGCLLYINYEDDNLCQRIGKVKYDHNTVATFELFLTLKQDVSLWYSRLPQFIKNLTKGSSTIVISPGFTLVKKKLYRSYQK